MESFQDHHLLNNESFETLFDQTHIAWFNNVLDDPLISELSHLESLGEILVEDVSDCNIPTNNKCKRLSDASKYGHRFVDIYNTYRSRNRLDIDLTKHLIVLCLENLIKFISWARETAQVEWINTHVLHSKRHRDWFRHFQPLFVKALH
jgi:hypothetical protein